MADVEDVIKAEFEMAGKVADALAKVWPTEVTSAGDEIYLEDERGQRFTLAVYLGDYR